MTGPLMVLAACTVGLSAILTPAWPWLEHYLLGEEMPQIDLGRLFQPMLFVSLMLVLIGTGLGILCYYRLAVRDRRDAGEIDPLDQARPVLFHFLERKMWVDEVYEESSFSGAGLRRGWRIGWIVTSGTGWFDWSAASERRWEFSRKGSMSAASMPALTNRPAALADWAL